MAPSTMLKVPEAGRLKSRPQLLAEFAGDIKATMSKAAYLFNALPTKAVRTIDALREKQEKAA